MLNRVFVKAAESAFVHAVRRRLAAMTVVAERLTGKNPCELLRRVPPATDPALVEGVVALAAELDADAGRISTEESRQLYLLRPGRP